MRLVERIARLERTGCDDPWMSAAEIDTAAVRYEAELLVDGTPCGGSVEEALAAFRRLVGTASEPWLQRIYVGMSPADLFA